MRSVLKQSLPDSQHKFLQTSEYEAFIEAAQNFIGYVTIFVTDWAQKTSLTKLGLERLILKQSLPNSQHKLLQTSQYKGYIEAAKNFIEGRTIFDLVWAQKSHLAKLVVKHSILKQSLPNSQHKLLQKSQYEAYIEAAQNFIEALQFS